MVDFGRVISDRTTYAYICDVVVDTAHRKQGIGKRLITMMTAHPELQGLKTWALRTTEEARSIYEKLNFKIAEQPETQLEINDLDIYTKQTFINLHQR